jgi:hypothetical protein
MATKADRYVELRRAGHGVREAAREAGFKHGVPSTQARQLYARVELAVSDPSIVEAAHRQATRARAELKAANQWIKAGQWLGVATS